MELTLGAPVLTAILAGKTFKIESPNQTLLIRLEKMTDEELLKAICLGFGNRRDRDNDQDTMMNDGERVPSAADLDMLDHVGRKK